MNVPPGRDEPQSLQTRPSKVTDLATARSAREIDRIAAAIDRHRDRDSVAEIIEDHDTVRKILSARRLLEISRQVDVAFDGPFLSNPGWDILLDLFIQRSEGKRISVISVCIAANAPTSTVLRYLQALMDAGTVNKIESPDDHQGMLIELSDSAYAKMKNILV